MGPIDTMKRLHQTNGHDYLHNQLCNVFFPGSTMEWVHYISKNG